MTTSAREPPRSLNDLARNDVPAALAFAYASMTSGRWDTAAAQALLMLQDDWRALNAALLALSAGGRQGGAASSGPP